MKKYILMSGFVTALCGCSANIYKPPTTGNIASLTVPSFNTEYRLLGGFSGGGVMLAEKGDDGCGRVSEIGKSEIGKKDVNVTVSADNDLFLSIFKYNGNTNCTLNTVFLPEKNKKYLVLFGQTHEECGVAIVEDNGDSNLKPVKLRKSVLSGVATIKACEVK